MASVLDDSVDIQERLRIAAMAGQLGLVEYLVEHGANRLYSEGAYTAYNIALYGSVENGHLPAVQYLVEHGADVRADDDYALCWSAARGHLPVVQYLVEQGADVRAQDDFALRWSAANGHLPVVQYLVEQGADVHADDDFALCRSAENGHLPVVQYLVEHGVNVHTRYDYALCRSAEYGHIPVVQYLVEHGADVHARDDEALWLSSMNGYLPIVQYLVAHGADVHARDDSALWLSSRNGHLPIVQYLVEHGADVHAREYNMLCEVVRQGPDDGILHFPNTLHSVLRVSASRGHLLVVQYLLKQGAHIRIPPVEGEVEVRALKRLFCIGRNDAYEVARDRSKRVCRYLLRMDFAYYMEKSVGWGCRPTEMLNIKNQHKALVRAMYTTMGRCTAMDVQHVVVEMLVGTSVMSYFRKAIHV